MQPNLRSNRLRDILLLVFSLVSILVLLGRGIYLAVTGFVPSTPQSTTTLASDIYGALSMLFCAVLLLPAVFLSLRLLKGRVIHIARVPSIKLWQVAVLLGVWILVIIFGSIIIGLINYGWAAAAPFFLLGIAIPVAGLVWIAIGGLPTGSWRRLWAALGIGMTASTSVAMILELIVAGSVVLVAGIIAALNPASLAALEQLKDQISNAGDIQALLPILAPYLNNPLVFLSILIFVAGIGPLIEEAIKPLAVWLVWKRLRSPAEGFVLGALCGAGFALLEGMLVTSGATEMLGFSLTGRATSSLMHITASGLMGWAIASALLEKRYGRLAWTYLLSVTIHGLWNGSVLLAVYGGLRLSVQETNPDLLGGISVVAGVGLLGAILISVLVILPVINSRLRPAPPMQSDIIAPPQS